MRCKIEGIRRANAEPFDYPELEVLRMPLIQNKHCPQCGKEMTRVGKFCGRSCASKSARRGQLAWEQAMAKQMEDEGWTIISPTACCDRVGIKNGRVYFIEFKTEGSTGLRSFQQAVKRVAPHMFRVVIGTREAKITTTHGDGRAVRAQNMQRRKRSSSTSSRFLGVSWVSGKSKWRACLTVNGKLRHLGYFAVEEEAARAYDDELQRRRGVTVNFVLDPECGNGPAPASPFLP